MMKKLFSILLLTLCLLPLRAQYSSGETKGVAIMDVVDKQKSAEYGQKLLVRGALTTAVNRIPGYEAYERVDFDDMAAAEVQFQQNGTLSEDMIKYIGRRSGAKYILKTEIAPTSLQDWVIVCTIVDITTTRVANSAQIVCSFDDSRKLDKACEELASRLLTSVAPSVQAPEKKPQVQRVQGEDYVEKAYGVDMSMVFVEGGEFKMGGTSEQDKSEGDEWVIRQVTVHDFYIGKYEVTQAQWEAVMGSNVDLQARRAKSKLNGKGANYPMYYVSWEEASEFCSVLSKKTGKHYSLPTEAEWEYAARGGQKSKRTQFAGSDYASIVAWYTYNSNSTNPVGTLKANELGLYDMSGNVWEWCYDWYGRYDRNTTVNPLGPFTGKDRVLRGGGWRDQEQGCRVAYRGHNNPDKRFGSCGFRVVCYTVQ